MSPFSRVFKQQEMTLILGKKNICKIKVVLRLVKCSQAFNIIPAKMSVQIHFAGYET